MKRLLSAFFISMSVCGWSQSANVVKAQNYLKSRDYGQAKEAIDAAVVHHKTKSDEKAWRVRGDVYFELSSQEGQLDQNAMETCVASYSQALSLNPSADDKNNIQRNVGIIQAYALNGGVESFNDTNYDVALKRFDVAIGAADLLGWSDTLALYNKGLTLERSERYEEAGAIYEHCADLDYKGEQMLQFAYYVYTRAGNQSRADEILEKGRKKYPHDMGLLTYAVNDKLRNGQFEEALTLLKLAIEQDPDNHILFFSLGSVCDNLRMKAEAEEAYLKALKLEPDYFDARYNLGALYFNQGVEVQGEANDMEDNDTAVQVLARAKTYFEKALPHMEKAEDLNPEDRNTLTSLVQLYARLDMTEDYKRIKEKIGG